MSFFFNILYLIIFLSPFPNFENCLYKTLLLHFPGTATLYSNAITDAGNGIVISQYFLLIFIQGCFKSLNSSCVFIFIMFLNLQVK